ncbi:hypothetical protein WH47_10717 [Habropoda laboriosa]|uniref:MADF domain-containing protein n=1 Tax=Habropoda laboriosa TaxID=597456 RepID=A0A0L7RBY2_9HYME|nr:PREDICTED: uncharacterized protein LOC108579743 [Habropoda laboriosa]KOC68477.1 hypothetical protein WH47_10717 [Habropoda laboriosa]
MAARKEWSKDEIFNLISMYEENSVLWNTKDIEHRNRERKNKIIEEMAASFNCLSEEIQRKIHNLRNQMSQELRKKKKKKNWSRTDDVDVSNWPYFAALKFLIPVLSMNAIQSSYIQVEKIEPEEHATENNAESEERTKIPMQPPRKRRRENDDVGDQLIKSALETLQREPDEYDKFGQYVALELKSLKSDFNKARLKSEIRKVIVRIADEDLYGTPNTSSVSTPMPSPAFQPELELG